MKYREDMMENHEKGPRMRSDRLRITTNTLDLEVSTTCSREKERELLDVCGRFGGEEKGFGHISPRVAGPTILRRRRPSATSRRTVRLYNFRLTFPLKLPLINFSQQRRTVRRPLADRPCLAQWTHHRHI